MTRGNKDKQVRLLPVCVMLGASKRRPTPITVRNGLPVTLIPMAGHKVDILVLVDTCAAMSVGNLDTHKEWMKAYPRMVTEFREFNDEDPFKPIKLGGAVMDPDTYDEEGVKEEHGALTAVMRYLTDLYFPDRTQLVLSFALGKEVADSTILGWPTIEDLNLAISPWSMMAYFSELQQEFALIRHDTVLPTKIARDLPCESKGSDTVGAVQETEDGASAMLGTPVAVAAVAQPGNDSMMRNNVSDKDGTSHA